MAEFGHPVWLRSCQDVKIQYYWPFWTMWAIVICFFYVCKQFNELLMRFIFISIVLWLLFYLEIMEMVHWGDGRGGQFIYLSVWIISYLYICFIYYMHASVCWMSEQINKNVYVCIIKSVSPCSLMKTSRCEIKMFDWWMDVLFDFTFFILQDLHNYGA